MRRVSIYSRYHLNKKKQIYPVNRVLYPVNDKTLSLDSLVLSLSYITKRGEHHKIGSDPFQSMTAFFHLYDQLKNNTQGF